MGALSEAWLAYRLRWKRRRLLWRALKARHALRPVANRTGGIGRDDILCFACVRNEATRLPWFLDHHRRIGVGHFLFVDNGSDDGGRDFLAAQPDVSLWETDASYRVARFGLDWTQWLLLRHGHGHWCLTLDADECFVFPHHDRLSLRTFAAHLDRTGQPAVPALMLDLYPEGRLSEAVCPPGGDPFTTLTWFDADGYSRKRQMPLDAGWVQGGVRARVFFRETPSRAPTLNKLPFVRWNRRYAYVNSTHTMLPRRLNRVDLRPGCVWGAILHAKFLDSVIEKAREDRRRRAHFHDPDAFASYYEALAADPVLWTPGSTRYEDWRQLVALDLMPDGGWTP